MKRLNLLVAVFICRSERKSNMLILDMPTGKYINVEWNVSTCERCHRVFNVRDLVLAPKNEEDMTRTIYCKNCCEILAQRFEKGQ